MTAGMAAVAMDEEEKSILPLINTPRRLLDSRWIKLNTPPRIQAWDGLRGIALLGPLYAHIRPFRYENLGDALGAVGLKIFMILAGMLTTMIFAGRQASLTPSQNRYANHIVNYRTRFYRIWPALFFSTVSVTALFVVRAAIQSRGMPRGLAMSIVNTLTYMSDIDPLPAQDLSPWKQTWTIAVMEKGFALWGVALAFILTLNPRHHRLVVSVLLSTVAVLLLGRLAFETSLTKSKVFRNSGFFGEIWSLLLGYTLPFLDLDFLRHHRQKTLACGLGLTLLSALKSVYVPDADLILYGLPRRFTRSRITSLLNGPIAATLIIYGTMDGNSFLEHRYVQLLGRYSYGLYLFQVPISSFVGMPRVGWAGLQDAACALVLAIFTSHYIEGPIRTWARRQSRAE